MLPSMDFDPQATRICFTVSSNAIFFANSSSYMVWTPFLLNPGSVNFKKHSWVFTNFLHVSSYTANFTSKSSDHISPLSIHKLAISSRVFLSIPINPALDLFNCSSLSARSSSSFLLVEYVRTRVPFRAAERERVDIFHTESTKRSSSSKTVSSSHGRLEEFQPTLF